MKKGKSCLLLSIFIIALSLYLYDTAVAMEPAAPPAEQEPALDAELEAGPGEEPALDAEPEAGPGEEPASDAELEAGPGEEPASDAELAADAEGEPEQQPEAEPVESMAEPAFVLQLPPEPVETPGQDGEADCISSAAELTGWLESHKYSGGRAVLTGDITMNESYMFLPYPNMPPLFVETGEYTIFVCADTEFWSDGNLTFTGEGNEQGIFHVEQGCMLLDGVTVETAADGASRYALWQEEGAGLILGNTFASCHVSGNIHYAQTPLVTEAEPVCVVVERGELLDGCLPTEITCKVNARGTLLKHEPVAVSWDMAGTEKQQAGRRRFQVQGSFSQAAAGVRAACTVIYNDFPLTFTNAEAFIRSHACTFRGNYTKQEGALCAAVSPEYSFDGENWIGEGEDNTLSADSSFYISFPGDQWDVAAYPYAYIRLRGETEGKLYYSNVLRYAANNLDVAEDLGGSRGGGTAIVDPPGEPEKPEESAKPNESLEPEEPIIPGEPHPPLTQQNANEPNANDKAAESGKTEQTRRMLEFEAEERKNASIATLDWQYHRGGNGNGPDGHSQSAGDTAAKVTAGSSTRDLAMHDTPADREMNAAVEACAQPEFSVRNDSVSMAAGTGSNYGLLVGIVVLSVAFGAVCFFASKGTNR